MAKKDEVIAENISARTIDLFGLNFEILAKFQNFTK